MTDTGADLCPKCGQLLEAASALDGKSTPRPEDISLCFYCGEVLQFGSDLRLHVAPAGLLEELSEEQRRVVAVLQANIRRRRVPHPDQGTPNRAARRARGEA